jgi:hypothetical protein
VLHQNRSSLSSPYLTLTAFVMYASAVFMHSSIYHHTFAITVRHLQSHNVAYLDNFILLTIPLSIQVR